jgi:hypothetical protein
MNLNPVHVVVVMFLFLALVGPRAMQKTPRLDKSYEGWTVPSDLSGEHLKWTYNVTCAFARGRVRHATLGRNGDLRVTFADGSTADRSIFSFSALSTVPLELREGIAPECPSETILDDNPEKYQLRITLKNGMCYRVDCSEVNRTDFKQNIGIYAGREK